jgi:hypothetical protein
LLDSQAGRKFALALYPAKMTAALTHARLCRSYHIEFEVPEGVRIYGGEMIDDRGKPQCR